MPKRVRNYEKEYRDFQGTPEQIERRSARNKARRKMEKLGKVKKGDGREVDHKNFDATDNRASNLRVLSKKANRKRQPKRD